MKKFVVDPRDDLTVLKEARRADQNASQCLKLWRHLLLSQWNDAFKGRLGDVARARDDARRWFSSRDFRMICELAGFDPDAVFERFEAKLAQDEPPSAEALAREAALKARKDAIRRGEFAQPVTIRGVEYKTVAAAARALGVNENTIRQAAQRGMLDKVGLSKGEFQALIKPLAGDGSGRGGRLEIDGVVFESSREASIKLGFGSEGHVSQTLRRGSPQGLRRIVEAARLYKSEMVSQ